MPNMANITVKKADGTTDVVYTALAPAGGEGLPARWTLTAAASQANLRPVLDLRSRMNGNRDARVLNLVFKYPDVRSVSGVDTVVGTIPVNISATIPLQVTDTVIAEAIHQAGNLFVSVLVRDSFKSGYAPQ